MSALGLEGRCLVCPPQATLFKSFRVLGSLPPNPPSKGGFGEQRVAFVSVAVLIWSCVEVEGLHHGLVVNGRLGGVRCWFACVGVSGLHPVP